MQHIQIICVGGLKERYLKEACAEYDKRLTAFCNFTIMEVGEERLPDNPSDAQIAVTLEKEGEKILSKIPKGASVVALCIEGKKLSSEKLADFIADTAVNGVSHLVFIIGGSWGLSPAVKQRAVLRLSMSDMTFPHQLARVMLCEQIYRAFQINSGGKYHK